VRRLSLGRRLTYLIAKPVFKALFKCLWFSCRIQPVIGEEHIEGILKTGFPMIPCYWHQRHIFGTYYMLQLLRRGLKVGFLVSPSVDGEVPAQVMRDWGAKVIRGSHTRSGAKTVRDLYKLISHENVSPVNTPDGPTGPIHYFKPGTLMLAQLTQVPIVPISYAAKNAWILKTWDRFILPIPFTRVQIVVGEPQYVAKNLSEDEMEVIRVKIEDTLQLIASEAETHLN
jgi:lysophospholipid acyltransferase (LPLAT)-like uncharacterized protein